MTIPTHIREKAGVFWVLADYESESSPGKMYEVRTSQRDNKTYCTCRGWIQMLNKSKATGCEAVCTHIAQFRRAKPTQTIVMADFESFAIIKRGISMMTGDEKVGIKIKVRRS